MKDKTFVLSDSHQMNSHGFRIDLNGLDLERFNANPVMLYRHCSDDVIGSWKDVRVESGKLLGVPVFDPEDELAQKVAGKVDRGFLKGCSVGILINEMNKVDGEYTVTAAELMEASLCSIPSDAGAVMLYNKDKERVTLAELTAEWEHNAPIKNNLNPHKMEDKEKTAAEEAQAQLQAELTQAQATIATLTAEKEAAAKKAKEAAAAAKKQAIADMVAEAKKDGKIKENEVEGYTKLATADFDSVKALFDARPAETTPAAPAKTVSLAAQCQGDGKKKNCDEDSPWDERMQEIKEMNKK